MASGEQGSPVRLLVCHPDEEAEGQRVVLQLLDEGKNVRLLVRDHCPKGQMFFMDPSQILWGDDAESTLNSWLYGDTDG